MARKFIQILTVQGYVIALCDDGTIWSKIAPSYGNELRDWLPFGEAPNVEFVSSQSQPVNYRTNAPGWEYHECGNGRNRVLTPASYEPGAICTYCSKPWEPENEPKPLYCTCGAEPGAKPFIPNKALAWRHFAGCPHGFK
jgi:hypothetical protein